MIDVEDEDEDDSAQFDSMPRRVVLSEYSRCNKNDNILDPQGDLCQFLLSLANKSNVGVHIDLYNE